jgi:hypothetical protein
MRAIRVVAIKTGIMVMMLGRAGVTINLAVDSKVFLQLDIWMRVQVGRLEDRWVRIADGECGW